MCLFMAGTRVEGMQAGNYNLEMIYIPVTYRQAILR